MAQRGTLLGIQQLRAVAALMVVYFHLCAEFPGYATYLTVHRRLFDTNNLANGVPVFFVISGFVMYLSGIDSTPRQFIKRRLVRIVPLYWILTIAVAMLAVAKPHLLRDTVYSTGALLKSLLFIPYRSGPIMDYLPLLAPGWSLNYEMAFYALFAAALMLPKQWRIVSLCGALVALGLMAPYSSLMLLLFAAGLVLGWAHSEGALRMHAWRPVALMVAGFAALLTLGGVWPWTLLPASVAIVLGALSVDLRSAALLSLGDASYSLYLTHPFTLTAMRMIWPHRHSAFWAVSFAIAGVGVSCIVAVASYRMIEKPSLALLSQPPAHKTEMPVPLVN